MNQLKNQMVPEYIKRLSHFLSQLIQKRAEPYVITNAQLNMMFCLLDDEPVTQKQLLQYLDIKSSSLTVLLKQLEDKGLIARKLNSEDSRAKIITISEKGKEFIHQTILPIGEELEKDILKGFDQSEKKQLFHYFDRLLSNMEEMKKFKE